MPLVLEARGLDVTPEMAATLERVGDPESAAVLRRIYRDEIDHVAAGVRWFDELCRARGLIPERSRAIPVEVGFAAESPALLEITEAAFA